MRKLFYALLVLLCSATAHASPPGDTTWVQANNVQLNYYNNFDTLIDFPAAGNFRKIYMFFTLGKYVCPGSPTYCGDWDYTVQTIFMGKTSPDTVELGRLITPYAHTGYGRFSAGWTNRYIFDVTDYYPVLRDKGTVRIHYSGYSGGFTANVKFAFIEGTPERSVIGIERLWHGDFAYGHGGTPINTALGTLSRNAPAGTVSTEVKMNITGHGGDDNGCAEFCPNSYTLLLNGANYLPQPFYRADCSANDLYPQSGTWIWARANWCPGALVHTFSHPLSGITGSSRYTIGMSFPAYTSPTAGGGSPASYTIDAAAIYYGAIKKTLDASLDDIIAPTDAEYHWRENPTSIQPRLFVRNTGSTTISSIKFEYSVSGKSTQTYTWAGSIAPLNNMEIALPTMADLKLSPGTYGFTARIAQVNGTADDDVFNDRLLSTFTAAPAMPADFQVDLKSNNEGLPSNSNIGQTAWRIEDVSGVVVKRRSDCPINTVCTDTVHLVPGNAYKLVVTDSGAFGYYSIPTSSGVGIGHGSGLSGFSTTAGFLRISDLENAIPITLPGYFGGNFGSGFTQYFYVGSPNAVQHFTTSAPILRVFPNPASKQATVLIDGVANSEGMIHVLDLTGRVVASQSYSRSMMMLDISALVNGLYLVEYTGGVNGNTRLQERLSIVR